MHVGGTLEEIAASERDAWEGRHAERPFVLLAQPTPFDRSRAPAGKHTAWAYCHVPHGSTVDMLPRIEAQIERFAPGFRDRVLARARHDRRRPSSGAIRTRRRRHRRRASPTRRSSSRGRPWRSIRRPCAAVPVLGIDAAGRGGTRDVRLPRGAACARGSAVVTVDRQCQLRHRQI